MAQHDDVIFPTGIVYGSSSGVHDEVTELFTPGGLRTVINRREEPLQVFDVSYIGDTESQRSLLDTIAAMRRGQTVLIRNPNFWNSSTDQSVATAVTNLDMQLYNPTDDDYEGDGSTLVFRLEVQFSPGAALTQTKRIWKPLVSSIVIADDGSPAGAHSVSAANGEVTFSVAPADGNALTWGGEWWTPIYNASDDLAIQSLHGQKVTDTTGLRFMEEVLS